MTVLQGSDGENMSARYRCGSEERSATPTGSWPDAELKWGGGFPFPALQIVWVPWFVPTGR
jgi:hypothetical protein